MDKIISFIGGDEYKGAVIPAMIMALYPLHQTYGQINGSICQATDKTKLYRNVGCLSMLAGLGLSFFLIAPKKFYGLELAANGLAIKTIAINFVTVNVFAYYNTKYLKCSFWKYLIHQFIIAFAFLAIAFVAKVIIENVVFYNIKFEKQYILQFLLSGLLYSILVYFMVVKFPSYFGISKEEIIRVINLIKLKLAKIIG
ncbi:MAG: polysaccharide biosynthesis C-terminal domain-containing protein [Oligoflexia bacterium]|nr:polysaccharide biosynthesis C-terminal domain-containing protein [Oligoflexia bacterium]